MWSTVAWHKTGLVGTVMQTYAPSTRNNIGPCSKPTTSDCPTVRYSISFPQCYRSVYFHVEEACPSSRSQHKKRLYRCYVARICFAHDILYPSCPEPLRYCIQKPCRNQTALLYCSRTICVCGHWQSMYSSSGSVLSASLVSFHIRSSPWKSVH